MNIIIFKNENNSLFAYKENTSYPLFQFEFRSPIAGDGWHFWLKGCCSPDIFHTTEFPMEFFVDACKATAFIRHNVPLSEEVTIVGEELIKANPTC